MDGVELHRLGKRLIELSRVVADRSGPTSLTPAEIAVLEAALAQPDCTVSDISNRSGFAQSHVSASVARLVGRGLVRTREGATDRRQTCVRLTPLAGRAIRRRARRPVADVLEDALADAGTARRAETLLDELHDLFSR